MAHFRDHWKVNAAMALLLIGIGLISYPFLGSFLSHLTQAQAIDGYLSDVSSEDTLEMEAQIQQARDYNQQLLNSSAVMTEPFSMEAFQDALEGYDEILKINDTGIMGYLDIPSISVHLPIYHGTGTDALQHGVGHLKTTSFPVGGDSTHAVLSAHSGLPNADMFDRLPEMEVGDIFSITILLQTIYYQVYDIETVLPDQTASLYIQESKDLVTLVTCTPYGINTHRLLVHAERVFGLEGRGDITDTHNSGSAVTEGTGSVSGGVVHILLMVGFFGAAIFGVIAFQLFVRKIFPKIHSFKFKKGQK